MSQSKVLADQLYSGEGVAADLVRIATANILLTICAHIVIPLPFTPVPITGQTFGVLLVAVLLGARRSALAVVLYLLEGAAGLPVFQPLGLPGIARFVGPTAGYLVAYPFAAFATGWLVERGATVTLPRGFKSQPAGAPLVGAVLNKATAQDGYGYGYYGGYQPYVVPQGGSPDGARTARNGHGKQNGSPIPSGRHGR